MELFQIQAQKIIEISFKISWKAEHGPKSPLKNFSRIKKLQNKGPINMTKQG